MTTARAASFRRDGAVCVRSLFTPEEVAMAAAAIEADLADPSPLAKRASAGDDGAFIEDFCSWTRLGAIERFVLGPGAKAAAVAGELLASTTIRLYHDHVLVKEAGTRQRTPWHQDQPYYNVDGRDAASMWMPVDPVARRSTLEFVRGSHTGPWYVPRSFLDGQAKWFPEGMLAELTPIEPGTVIGWALEPGDAVFFHFATVHGSAGSAARRRVLSIRFLGDDVVYAPRPWPTSPPSTASTTTSPPARPWITRCSHCSGAGPELRASVGGQLGPRLVPEPVRANISARGRRHRPDRGRARAPQNSEGEVMPRLAKADARV